MKKISNFPFKDIMHFSKEQELEYHDILPEGICECLTFFKSLYRHEDEYVNLLYSMETKLSPSLRILNTMSPSIDCQTWISIPKTKECITYVSNKFLIKIFKLDPYYCEEYHLSVLKSVIAFLFDIKEKKINLIFKSSIFALTNLKWATIDIEIK